MGEKLPNPWGLYDILGNVWEWCQDDWQDGYNHIPVNASSALVNNSTGKSARGGHCEIRILFRIWGEATKANENSGLRVVMLPDPL